MELRKQIANWKAELLAPNKGDVLANLVSTKNAIALETALGFEEKTSLPQERLINKLFKEHRHSIKESGTPIFGVSQNLIEFELDNVSYCSPILIANCSIARNRYNKYFDLEQTEPFYLNPFLAKTFNIEEDIDSIEGFEVLVRKKGLEFKIKEGQWVANFHPHRFILVKELEQLEQLKNPSSNVIELLGDQATENYTIDLHEAELFSSDEDQLNVLQAVSTENTVIQGPPGTGKSQVIANLMGKILGKNHNALLVAEKKVALEVIHDKLKTHNLHYFCLLHHHELNAKDFVYSLKKTWKFLENRKKFGKPYVSHSKLAIDGLNLTLDRLRQKDLIGGISFSAFNSRFDARNTSKVEFIADVPDIPDWDLEKIELRKLESLDNDNKSWTYIKTNNESNYILKLEKALKKILSLIQSISIPEITRDDISKMMRKSGVAALFFYDDLLIPPAIFEPESTSQKKFLKTYDKFIQITEECSALEEEKKHWKKSFSLSELQEYIKVLSTSSPFNLRSKYQRNKLLKFTDLNLNDAQLTLQNLVDLKKKEGELIKIKQQLRKLGVSNDLNELQHIHYVIRKTQQVDKNLVNALVGAPKEQLTQYKYLANELSELDQLAFHYLLVDSSEEIQKVVSKALSSLGDISSSLKTIGLISNQTKKIWRSCENIDQLERIILSSHWKKFQGRYPQLSNLNGSSIDKKIDDITRFRETENELFSNSIKDNIQEQFEKYHSLLQIPARKLSTDQKKLKKELRKGKSILVKAFAKSRSFPSIHDLLDSEAKKWIDLLHPIFLCSPYTVAKSLPLNHTFNLVIFDEASQLPLPNALGSLQRSKRVVVAGDQQQMAPHFYFQKNSSSTHDVLHQSSFYWKNIMLTNHYRSSHERLIEFSNRYFYENKLTTFPKPNSQEPFKLINVSGQFIDRVNMVEAKIAADEIQQLLKAGINDLGIVAFSKMQLEAIINELPPAIQDQIMDEDSPGFVQSLENVQGDQCAHLIISMGYAPNEDGNFNMRFGPLNQEQGHRRLNVLMSRAQEKIIFIRSVQAKDFAISDNEGVETLRKLMLFLEEEHSNVEHNFPEGIKSCGEDKIEINAPEQIFSSANEMVNYCHVLKQRGWKVGIKI